MKTLKRPVCFETAAQGLSATWGWSYGKFIGVEITARPSGRVSAQKAASICEHKITGAWNKAQGLTIVWLCCTILRYPKVASTTGRGFSGDVFVIRWLPLPLRHRVVLEAHPQRDFLAYSAFYVFRPSAQRPTRQYSGEKSKSACTVHSTRNKRMLFLQSMPVPLGSVGVPGSLVLPSCYQLFLHIWTFTSLSQVHSERVLSKRVLDRGGKSQ